jgi:uncharacterized protein YjiS (DUF1127 family)
MNIFGNIRSWNRERMTRNELAALSNRELADIGIVRGDIARVAHRATR